MLINCPLAAPTTVPPPVDPCESEPCQNGGTCVNNEDGTYKCECLTGWIGKNCDLRKYSESLWECLML